MSTALNHLINGIPSLGTYTRVMAEIETVLNEPHSTLADLGNVIEKDPDLTARLLKLGKQLLLWLSQPPGDRRRGGERDWHPASAGPDPRVERGGSL